MNNPAFRKRFRRTVFILLSLFLFLFGFRLLYSYTSGGREYDSGYISNFFNDNSSMRHNYASEKTSSRKSETTSTTKAPAKELPATAPAGNNEIKFEKKADIRSRTSTFEKEEELVRKKLLHFNGIIQHEQNTGRKGDRELHLQIGVPPEKFDSCFQFLKSIGRVQTADVTKTDQTSEYKKLEARRLSLEKTRESLIEFKRQSGRIEEFMNLQNRILEIEEELQGLGVSLGDFSAENEFCTIQLSLLEGNGPAPISTLHRLKVTFEWTVKNFLYSSGILALTLVAAYFFILLIDKLKPIWQNILKRMEKKE